MLYLLWSLFLIVYVFGYKHMIRMTNKTATVNRVDSIVVAPLNKIVFQHPSSRVPVRNVTNIQKIIDEKKRLREQYEVWKENARMVNEHYNRKHVLHMKSG